MDKCNKNIEKCKGEVDFFHEKICKFIAKC